MPGFPQLLEEDFQQITAALNDLLTKSEARTALIVEKAGYLIIQCGDTAEFDTTELATLAANAFAATQFMADRLKETNFSSMYQQGETMSVLWLNVDECSLLVVVFKASLSVGMVKYYATDTIKHVADQMTIAHQRAPSAAFDIADLNPTDVAELFHKKEP